MVRPRLYMKDFDERLPVSIRISRNNQGRLRFYKSITEARNYGEVVDIALDALQEKISAKKRQSEHTGHQKTPPIPFHSQTNQDNNNEKNEPANAAKR